MARPSVCLCEFQQVESEYMSKRPDAAKLSTASGHEHSNDYKSAYRAVNIAEKRAAFILRRRRSLGFSKCRWLRTVLSVPSRSIFFFNRRRAFSTGSPFFSLISVKSIHFLSIDLGTSCPEYRLPPSSVRGRSVFSPRIDVNRQKRAEG